MCKYCDEDRMIEQGAIYFGEQGKIACINSKDEFVVNIKGSQMNIRIKYCPFCGEKLKEIKCPACGGSGRYKDGKCGACNGTGYEI